MAFNFGAFVGGMSKQIVSDIEREEEYELKMKQIAETEAMRQRAARAGERRKKQAALEASIGALKFLGYNDAAAAQIARQGEYAVQLATNAGELALEKGKDINTIIRMPNINEDITTSAKELNSTIEGPKTSTIGIFDMEAYRGLIAEPDDIANSYASRLAQIAQKQARVTRDSDEWNTLQSEEDLILSKVKAYHDAQRENKDEDDPDPSVFGFGTLEATVGGVRANVLSDFKFELSDIERGIAKRVDGDEGRYGVALLRIAEELQATYGQLDDKLMNDRIAFQRNEAIKNLQQYGNSVAKDTGNTYRRSFNSGQEAMNAINNKDVRIGDVVIWKDKAGNMKIAVYTGFIDPDTNVPLVMAN